MYFEILTLLAFAIPVLAFMLPPVRAGVAREAEGMQRFRAFADGPTIESLKESAQSLNVKAQQIQAKADSEGRELTDEELDEIESLNDEFDEIVANIERRERIVAQADRASRLMDAGQRRVPAHDPADPDEVDDEAAASAARAQASASDRRRGGDGGGARSHRVSVRNNLELDPKRGFAHLGEFALAVHKASKPSGFVDPRLTIMGAPTTVSTETQGADGGFAVPPDFRESIAEKITGDASLLGRTNMDTTSRNSITQPLDETSPWDSTNGIQAAWGDELAQLSQSKMQLKESTLRLNKLTALVPVTEELLEDGPMIDGYLRRKTPVKMNQKINEAIVRGDGVGKPLGLLNAGAVVTVAAESGPQTADTIVAENIVKMWSRMPAANRMNAVWLANQDIEPQLLLLKLEGSSGGVFPLYLPPGGLSASPYGTIMGRPVIPCESCSVLGDAGDLIFVDLMEYQTAIKSSGIRVDVSMHLWFDYDTMAYRFIFRVAGQPMWTQAWDRRDGNSPTLSPYVVLGARTGS